MNRRFYRSTLLVGILICATLSISQKAFPQQAGNDEYSSFIKSADEAYTSGNYQKAIDLYNQAANLKPGNKDLNLKLDKARKAQEDQQKSKNLSFEDAILEGERLFKSKDYPSAKRQFENALELDPSSQYARERLVAIRQFYSDPADIAKFNSAIQGGDEEFSQQRFDAARELYKNALAIQSDSKIARQKLDETDRRQAEAIANEQKYKQLMLEADQLLKAEKREDARDKYQQALAYSPSDPIATAKIHDIDNYLNTKKLQQETYDKAIELGDQYYLNRDFVNARIQYQEALKIKPQARYPKEMLDKAGQGESQLQTIKERYDAIIASADNFYNKGKLEESLPAYRSALELIPGSEYPAGRIKGIEKSIAERNSRKEAYDLAINNGELSFSESRYPDALGHFKNALTLFPEEQYPKDKIQEINTLLGRQKEAEAGYTKAIQTGDARFKEKKYQEAILAYEQALSLKPEEKYPGDKIGEIQKLVGEMKNRDSSYLTAIQAGDSALENKDYDLALTSFKDASAIKPGENYPRQKITEVNALISKIKTTESRYNSLIGKADNAYDEKNFIQALSFYREASQVAPAEKYPLEKIKVIETTLAEEKVRKENYQVLIAEADKLFAQKENMLALQKYQEAKGMQPQEKYPQQKISEINALMDKEMKANTNYAAMISSADSAFDGQKLELALSYYQSALSVKPLEKYPQEKVSTVRQMLAEQKKKNDAFDQAILEADKHFDSGKYEEALTAYHHSLTIKPGEKYPLDQVSACNQQIKQKKQQQDTFDSAVAEGDQFLGARNYQEALNAYRNASLAKPSESYPSAKIKEINEILEKVRLKDENYAKAIQDGDAFFTAKKYREALEPYERASTIKPEETYPKTQKEKIAIELAEEKKLDEKYNILIAEADQSLEKVQYREALSKYEAALQLKPEMDYPKNKISTIQKALADFAVRDEKYNNALAEGDSRMASGNLAAALDSYKSALSIKPGEAYPADKIKAIETELQRIDNKYGQAIADADRKLTAKEYSDALNFYQQALDIKPGEPYPSGKIVEINETLAREKEEQERLYVASIQEGDQLLSAQNYADAKRAFLKASGIKPSEQYPKDKLIEINLVLDARAKALKSEYDKVILDADKLYLQKILDQAVESYEKAAAIKPDESYPGEMIRKIRQYIADHSILRVNNEVLVIGAGDEHKFSFTGIEPRLRTNNYVMIRAKALGNVIPKVYFNYGRDNAKNGGIVLRTISNKEGVDYLIRLTGQDTWYRENNNWISLYTEGCDLEVSRIEISQGD